MDSKETNIAILQARQGAFQVGAIEICRLIRWHMENIATASVNTVHIPTNGVPTAGAQ